MNVHMNHVSRDIVFGQDSGDRKCDDCGKMDFGRDWIEEDRKRLAETKGKPK